MFPSIVIYTDNTLFEKYKLYKYYSEFGKVP